MIIKTKKLQTTQERLSANRSRLYFLIAESFRYPDTYLQGQISDGNLKRAIEMLLDGLPYKATELFQCTPHLQIKTDDIEVEFIWLFESGPGSPPCPLVEGEYTDDRMAIFKELILFYNHFGLSYAEGARDQRPDHICLEMEFLHYLTFKEVNALQKGNTVIPYIRAQRDFISRHPSRWIPKAIKRLDQLKDNFEESKANASVSFYRGLLKLTETFLDKELRYLEDLIPRIEQH